MKCMECGDTCVAAVTCLRCTDKLKAENELQYKKGYEDGVRAYAWWKDGVQYVGSCGKTLEQALKDV